MLARAGICHIAQCTLKMDTPRMILRDVHCTLYNVHRYLHVL